LIHTHSRGVAPLLDCIHSACGETTIWRILDRQALDTAARPNDPKEIYRRVVHAPELVSGDVRDCVLDLTRWSWFVAGSQSGKDRRWSERVRRGSNLGDADFFHIHNHVAPVANNDSSGEKLLIDHSEILELQIVEIEPSILSYQD